MNMFGRPKAVKSPTKGNPSSVKPIHPVHVVIPLSTINSRFGDVLYVWPPLIINDPSSRRVLCDPYWSQECDFVLRDHLDLAQKSGKELSCKHWRPQLSSHARVHVVSSPSKYCPQDSPATAVFEVHPSNLEKTAD
ncbi:hypothetical protein KL939_005431 [Ogataea angusta]|nr:hypothetical protein KL939_005431 [Ogataea angusta]